MAPLLAVTGQDAIKKDGKITMVIHGGAGTILKANMTSELEQQYHETMQIALSTGYEILEEGGTSLDAVVATIKVMEDSPLFNAGKGAVFTSAGTNEMDASIMDGSNLQAGAVAGVTNIKNPITAALAVMENSPHVMMSGPGAEQFAVEQGLEVVDPSYFHTPKRYGQWQKIKATEKQQLDHSDDKSFIFEMKDHKFGTVGALALDQQGNLAAATSTGGMTNKRYGRIGDAPVIGAGTYADNQTCAVSSTGHGEYFIRSVVAYDIAALMKYKNISLDEAADQVVNEKLKTMGGSGGVVALDAQGNVSMPFNTKGMYRGYMKEKGGAKTFIYQKE